MKQQTQNKDQINKGSTKNPQDKKNTPSKQGQGKSSVSEEGCGCS